MSTVYQSNLRQLQEDKAIFEIFKHSALIQISNRITLQQRKIINALHLVIKDQLKRDPDRRLFTFEIGLLKRLAGIARRDTRGLKLALKKLTEIPIEYNVL